ncbi:hypothetical protein [Haloprofundus salilacus]|uniref:hypothetical protein n=1 Tax=Haloprofundus salilacus TaxID=2876190 RepID=UPI001CC9CF3E|nr:hypothetical protein [Haloprofundus salilacus]
MCFLSIAVVSGPAISGIDLTPEKSVAIDDESPFGDIGGNVTGHSNISKQGYSLKPGIPGSGVHKVQAPDANFTIDSVTGNVLIVYTIRIPELGYLTESMQVVNQDSPRELTFSIEDAIISSNQLKKMKYKGTAEVVVRKNGASRVVAQESITIIVG